MALNPHRLGNCDFNCHTRKKLLDHQTRFHALDMKPGVDLTEKQVTRKLRIPCKRCKRRFLDKAGLKRHQSTTCRVHFLTSEEIKVKGIKTEQKPLIARALSPVTDLQQQRQQQKKKRDGEINEIDLTTEDAEDADDGGVSSTNALVSVSADLEADKEDVIVCSSPSPETKSKKHKREFVCPEESFGVVTNVKCGFTCRSKALLRKHYVKWHPGVVFDENTTPSRVNCRKVCPVEGCGQVFRTETGLRQHKTKVHTTVRCGKCQLEYPNRSSFKIHLSVCQSEFEFPPFPVLSMVSSNFAEKE